MDSIGTLWFHSQQHKKAEQYCSMSISMSYKLITYVSCKLNIETYLLFFATSVWNQTNEKSENVFFHM